MERVLVITDSSACIPPDLAHDLGICVLPISASGPERELDLATTDETGPVPESVEREELLGANHPFVTEYLEAIETPGYSAAVVITPAIEFAAMFRNAAVAAELSEREVTTIDARTAAAGQALVVLAGAEAAQRGASRDEVAAVVGDAARRVELVASLANLDPLRRSGPVPSDVLGQPREGDDRSVFRMRDGNIEVIATGPSSDESLEAIRVAFVESASSGIQSATVFHAGAPQLAERLAAMLGGVDFISGFSVAMQVHTGRGVVGAAWLPGQAV